MCWWTRRRREAGGTGEVSGCGVSARQSPLGFGEGLGR